MPDEPTISLGRIATFEMGQSPPSSVVNDDNRGVPFLQGCAEFGPQFPKPRSTCLHPPKVCKKGDVLISVRAPVGTINKADREYCIGRGLAAVRLPDGYPENYGWHLLGYWAPSLRRVSQGTTFEAVGRDDLARLEIVDIQPEARGGMVAVLDSADEAIAKTEALITKLRAIKQGLLHDLLTRGLDDNGELRDPEKHPEQFSDSEMGRIPKDWMVLTVKDVGRIVAGATPSRTVPAYWGGEIPWITPTDMTALTSDYIKGGKDSLTRKGLSSCAAVLLPPESVVVTTRASLGLTAITCGWLATNQGFKNVIPDCGWDTTFLCYCFRALTDEMVKRASGTTFLEISATQFGLIRFAAPRLESGEQERIGKVIRAQTYRIELEVRYLSKLKAIKRGLMQDLLTGRVRVPADKIATSATG